MSAAHHFRKERHVSGAHENDERVNALPISIARAQATLTYKQYATIENQFLLHKQRLIGERVR